MVLHQLVDALEDQVDVLDVHGRVQEGAQARVAELLLHVLRPVLEHLLFALGGQATPSLEHEVEEERALFDLEPHEWLRQPQECGRDADDLHVNRDEPD